MKATIVYFSQTGNTRKVAESMAEGFGETGCAVECRSIEDVKPEHLAHSDIIGIGTPTFESHAPTPVKDFVRSLPGLQGRRCFVYATCGGAPGCVLADLANLLRRKGATVVDGFLASGEVHHPAPCIVGKSQGRPNPADLEDAKRFAAAIGRRIASTTGEDYDGFRPRRGFYSLVGKVTSSDSLVRLLEPQPKLKAEACKQCRRCAQACPMGNIALDPHPVHRGRCIRCYRCVNVCDHNAYAVDWRFGNLVVFELWNIYFMRWFGGRKP